MAAIGWDDDRQLVEVKNSWGQFMGRQRLCVDTLLLLPCRALTLPLTTGWNHGPALMLSFRAVKQIPAWICGYTSIQPSPW